MSLSILGEPPELVQDGESISTHSSFERALYYSPPTETKDRLLFLVGMEFDIYNELMIGLNYELYLLHILLERCVMKQ